MSSTIPWLVAARAKIGVREIVGRLHSAVILGWLKTLKAWWADDETAWCGTFVAICLREARQPIPELWMRALAWRDWGVEVSRDRLVPGTVVVISRAGGGHVGFYVGEGVALIGGHPVPALRVLGGNQGNRVCEAWIAKSRLVAARWPARVPITGAPVQLSAAGAALSTNEA